MAFRDRQRGGSFVFFILDAILRFLQLVFAIAVIGLYAQDLNKAHKEKKYTDGKWVFAVVVSTLAAVTALVYLLVSLILSAISLSVMFAWDVILFILWTALFGLFGSMYIHAKVEMDSGIRRMKNAVWVDLINMLLWFLSSCIMAAGFVRWLKGGRSLHTGRATV